jgi:tetratricopeptide (TPR) repeat protein
MLNWLNPFKWWRIFQQNRQWKIANRQFINSYHQQDFTTAETAGRLMVEVATKLGKRQLLLDSYYSLMLCYGKVDRLTRDIEQIESRHRGEHLTELEQWQNLMIEAAKLYGTGEIRAAIPIYEQALTIAREIFPATDNDLAVSLNNLAELYRSQGRWAEAEPLYDEALKICRELFGDRPNNDLAASLNNLALLYRSQGRWAEAEPLYDEALKIRRELFAERPNNDLAASLNNLALLYASQGRWAEAEPLYDEALKIQRELFGDRPNNDLAASLNNLGS